MFSSARFAAGCRHPVRISWRAVGIFFHEHVAGSILKIPIARISKSAACQVRLGLLSILADILLDCVNRCSLHQRLRYLDLPNLRSNDLHSHRVVECNNEETIRVAPVVRCEGGKQLLRLACENLVNRLETGSAFAWGSTCLRLPLRSAAQDFSESARPDRRPADAVTRLPVAVIRRAQVSP